VTSDKKNNKTIHVVFSGQVQGVGFRYTTREYAQRLGVTGWVKNLPDGRVEMMAQGDEETLMGLLKELKARFGAGLRDQQVSDVDHVSVFDTFEITY